MRSPSGQIGIVIAVAFLTLTGCAMKAGPAKPAGFIPADQMTKLKDLPFHKAWLKPGADFSRYTEVAIAPVNTEHLAKMDWWQGLERQSSVQADAAKLAKYAQSAFQAAFRNDPKRRFTVVETAGPKTLMWEVALIEVVPSKVVLNMMSYAPLVGTGAGVIRKLGAKSTVAFEARVRDGATGEILALFADREGEKSAPVNIKDLTWYGHAESILQEWARQFVAVASRKPDEAVQDSAFFTLKPW